MLMKSEYEFGYHSFNKKGSKMIYYMNNPISKYKTRQIKLNNYIEKNEN